MVESTENAKILLKDDVLNIGIMMKRLYGNELARRGFLSGVRWLNAVFPFIRSGNLFFSQILSPLKEVARYLVEVRKLNKTSLDLSAVVYAVSKPFFSKYFNEMVICLSAIIPELGTAMSYRCPYDIVQDQEGDMILKRYHIPSAQPLPLINRIHPTRFPKKLEVKDEFSKDLLDSCQNLSISLRDLHLINRLFTFEGYCETESTIYGKRRLGYPCIISGEVKYIDEWTVIISDFIDPTRTYEAKPAQCLKRIIRARGITKLNELVGRPAKMFIVVWYYYSKGKPEKFEVIDLNPYDDLDEVLINDASGYIRLRGQATLAELMRIYGTKLPDLECESLISEGSIISWRGIKPYGINPIIENFIETLENIKQIRINKGSSLLTLDQILDENVLTANGYANIVKRMKLLQPLIELMKIAEKQSFLARSPEELKEIIEKSSESSEIYPLPASEKIYYLKGMNLLIRKQGGAVKLSKFTNRIVYIAVRERLLPAIEKILNEQGWISIFELMELEQHPFPILLMGMQELEDKRTVVPIIILEGGPSIAWKLPNQKVTDEEICEVISRKISQLENAVINTLLDVAHPLSADVIVKELLSRNVAINVIVLGYILNRLRKLGRIQEKSQGMWFYPWERRVLDLLSSNPERIFTKEEIIERIKIPQVKNALLDEVLTELISKGAVESVNGYFAIKSDDANIRNNRIELIIEKKAKQILLRILRKYKRLDRLTLEARMRSELTPIINRMAYKGIKMDKIVNRALVSLAVNGNIRIVNDLIFLSEE